MRWWMKLIALLAVVVLLAWLGFSLVKGLVAVLDGADLSAGERDPMFAEEVERIERPAELDAEEKHPERPTLDDYVPEVESPVDQTIEELIREAQTAQGSNVNPSQDANSTENAVK